MPDERMKMKWMQDIDDILWKEVKLERSTFTTQVLAAAECHNPFPFNIMNQGFLHNQSMPSLFLTHLLDRKGVWKKKYCVLEGSFLLLFPSKEDFLTQEKEPQTVWLLQANISLWPVMDRPHCFIIGLLF